MAGRDLYFLVSGSIQRPESLDPCVPMHSALQSFCYVVTSWSMANCLGLMDGQEQLLTGFGSVLKLTLRITDIVLSWLDQYNYVLIPMD